MLATSKTAAGGRMSGFESASAGRADRALAVLRIVLAALLFAHGLVRVLDQGVVPFGGFLSAQGLPLGLGIAWFVTGFELAAAPLLALGFRRLISPVCLVFVLIYACGIWLVHWPAGWFVVGAGRNGMEYSVLLIAGLLANAWRWWPDFRPRRKR
jgi:putative oxidoreductase